MKISASENILSYATFKIAAPLLIFCKRLNISPNFLTTISLLMALIAIFYFLNNGHGQVPALFWIVGVIIDHTDGQLARATNQVRKNAFRYDHFSDIAKITIMLSVFFFLSESLYLKILSLFCVIGLLWREILLVELKHGAKKTENSEETSNDSLRYKILTNLKNIFATFSGHTTIIFCVALYSSDMQSAFIIYLALVFFKDIVLYSYKLIRLERNCG